MIESFDWMNLDSVEPYIKGHSVLTFELYSADKTICKHVREKVSDVSVELSGLIAYVVMY